MTSAASNLIFRNEPKETKSLLQTSRAAAISSVVVKTPEDQVPSWTKRRPVQPYNTDWRSTITTAHSQQSVLSVYNWHAARNKTRCSIASDARGTLSPAVPRWIELCRGEVNLYWCRRAPRHQAACPRVHSFKVQRKRKKQIEHALPVFGWHWTHAVFDRRETWRVLLRECTGILNVNNFSW